MGFLEKRSGGYRARYRDPLGRLTSKTFTRKADAERWPLRDGGGPRAGRLARPAQRPGAEVEYLTLRADGVPVAKGGIDFAKEVGAPAIWQLATHPQLQGLGLATRLIGELESRAVPRGVRRLGIGVGVENVRARRLYEHLGYEVVGESEASWLAEAEDGSRFVYRTTCFEMLKVA